MQPERFVITPWFGNRPGATARALVLPGGGYTVDHPVLFWFCQVLAQAGYRVVTMRWQPDDQAGTDPQAFVEEAADALEARGRIGFDDAAARQAPRLLRRGLGVGARPPGHPADPGAHGRVGQHAAADAGGGGGLRRPAGAARDVTARCSMSGAVL